MLRFHHGFYFPFISQVFCGLLLIVSFFVTIEIPLVGLSAMFLLGFSFAVLSGIEFDVKGNRFRSYTIVYGIKFGKWLKLDEYPHICLLQRHYSRRTRFTKYKTYVVDQGGFNPDYSQLEIVITREDFREKIFIKTEKQEQLARQEADRIAALLGKSFVPYAPKRHPNNPRERKR